MRGRGAMAKSNFRKWPERDSMATVTPAEASVSLIVKAGADFEIESLNKSLSFLKLYLMPLFE